MALSPPVIKELTGSERQLVEERGREPFERTLDGTTLTFRHSNNLSQESPTFTASTELTGYVILLLTRGDKLFEVTFTLDITQRWIIAPRATSAFARNQFRAALRRALP